MANDWTVEVLKIQFSPVCGGEKIAYKFNQEKIQTEDKIIDLSTVEEGKQYDVIYPVADVTRESDGVLKVTLIQYHAPDAPEDERYPKPFKAEDTKLDEKLEVIKLKEIEPEVPLPHTPTPEERLQALEQTMMGMMMRGL